VDICLQTPLNEIPGRRLAFIQLRDDHLFHSGGVWLYLVDDHRRGTIQHHVRTVLRQNTQMNATSSGTNTITTGVHYITTKKKEKTEMNLIPKVDAMLLGASWLFAFVSLSTLPIVLSCCASLFVIYNQYTLYKKNKNVGKDK
jgi:hypothetical protein